MKLVFYKIVSIQEGESLTYEFITDKPMVPTQFMICARGEGLLQINCENVKYTMNVEDEWSHVTVPVITLREKGSHKLSIHCKDGRLSLDYIDIQIWKKNNEN